MSATFSRLFGPVRSRRLGLSLGVDMVPSKTCTLDCVYCECGPTTRLTVERRPWVPAAEILAELERFMLANPPPDYITFTGSGEPTLNSELGTVVRAVKQRHPRCRTALLTNGTLFTDPAVRAECMAFDLALPSLDAVSPEVFRAVNRCHASLDNQRIIGGLVSFVKEFAGPVWLEVFIVPGITDTPRELSLLKETLGRIGAARVQLNSLDRPGAGPSIKPVTAGRMEQIAAFLRPLPVEIISRSAVQTGPAAPNPAAVETILATCRRRPSTVEELAVLAGTTINEIAALLDKLAGEKRLTVETAGTNVFYACRQDR